MKTVKGGALTFNTFQSINGQQLAPPYPTPCAPRSPTPLPPDSFLSKIANLLMLYILYCISS